MGFREEIKIFFYSEYECHFAGLRMDGPRPSFGWIGRGSANLEIKFSRVSIPRTSVGWIERGSANLEI